MMFKNWTFHRSIGVTLACVSILIPYPFTQGVLYLLLLFLFIDKFISKKETFYRLKPVSVAMLLLAVFVFFEVLSLTYSDNIRVGLSQFEKKIPIILFVILFTLSQDRKILSFQKGLRYYSFGILVLLLISTGVVLYNLVFGSLPGRILYSGMANIDFFEGIGHRTYLGFIVLMAFPIWYHEIMTASSLRQKWPFLVILLLASTILFMSGARAILLSMIFLLSYLILFNISKKYKNGKVLLLSIASLFVLGIIIVLNSPRFGLVLEGLFNGDIVASNEPRVHTWRAAFIIIPDHWFWGYGIGDSKSVFQHALKEIQYGLGYKNNFNVHNQYLETWLAAGIIPTISLISLLVSLFFLHGKRKIIAGSFAIVAGINFMFESMLVRNIGVFPFVYWLLLLFMAKEDDTISKAEDVKIYKWTSLVLIFAFCGVLIISSRLVFDAQNPRSYLQVPFEEQKELLPGNSQVNTVQIDCNDLTFTGIAQGDFSVIPFYNTHANKHLNASASVWAFVPEGSPIGRLWFFIYNKRDKSITCDYDLSKKGTWQQLLIEGADLENSFEIGLRIDYFESNFADWNPDRGSIKFALPCYKLQ